MALPKKTPEVRPSWAKQVGQPHQAGIWLDCLVKLRLSENDDIEYQIRGVVDVPDMPYGDAERQYLVQVLTSAANLPTAKKYKFALMAWKRVEGGKGVQIINANPIPIITDNGIIGDIDVTAPPEVEAQEPNIQQLDGHAKWVREYIANQYLRFESRKALHQRDEDIGLNAEVITPSGKLGITNDTKWLRLKTHIYAEMQRRNEPPTRTNQHPAIEGPRPFLSGELCRKAADVASRQGPYQNVLVKYGKREHIEQLLHDGLVYLNPATNYQQNQHSQAVKDDELEITFKGGFVRQTAPIRYCGANDANRLEDFRPIYHAPTLEQDQFAECTIRIPTDYWTFCMSAAFDHQQFVDFDADACLIIKQPQQFKTRLLDAARIQIAHADAFFGEIGYVDPLGAAHPNNGRVRLDIPIHMTKTLRFAYQREVRLALLPKTHQDRLKPTKLHIEPLTDPDMAELVLL